ncbi:hypothetical protein [Streptomyces sp. OE57]|uniref:hypothetical protein n=1 Tax=Streptomyces lacaronensis TaxID=3379885 RepID=UPI0039B75796
MNHRGKDDWALVDVHDIEAFPAPLPKGRKRRLTVLRQFFRFARSQHIVLVDPTRTLTAKEPSGFRGRTLTLDQQRPFSAAGPPTSTSTHTKPWRPRLTPASRRARAYCRPRQADTDSGTPKQRPGNGEHDGWQFPVNSRGGRPAPRRALPVSAPQRRSSSR